MKNQKDPKEKKTYKPKLEPNKRVKLNPNNFKDFIKKDEEE